MNQKTPVAIIGYGMIGRTHREALAAVPEAELAAVVSRRGGPPEDESADLSGVRWFRTEDELYAAMQPEIVTICSPSGQHADQARRALEHGAHVFVEKPPAATVDELISLNSLAQQQKRHLAVVSQYRMRPQLAHVATLIQSGTLGRPLLGEMRLHWHRPQSYYEAAAWRATDSHGGSLPNQGWHTVDLLTWYFGPAAEVSGIAATLAHDIPVEDTTSSTITFASGALGSVVTTTTTPPGEPTELRLFFDKGSIRIEDTQVTDWAMPDDVPPPPSDGDTGSGAADPAAIGADSHCRQWQDLVDAVRAGTTPAVTAVDSLPTLALIEAVYESAQTGRRIQPRIEANA